MIARSLGRAVFRAGRFATGAKGWVRGDAPRRSGRVRAVATRRTTVEGCRSSYAYLLGMHLGDGSIDRLPRTWRLTIALDMGWPGIMHECEGAMQAVLSANRVRLYQPDSRSRCVVAAVHSNQLICLFPQHGSGAKHLRPIELVGWQREVVHPRYNFTNASGDIRGLFTMTCDLLAIEWRQMNARNISIARHDSVVRVDSFVGPKY
jgi:hypothetical protein